MLDSLRVLNCLDLFDEDGESNANVEVFLLNVLDLELVHDEMHHLFLKISHDFATLLI